MAATVSTFAAMLVCAGLLAAAHATPDGKDLVAKTCANATKDACRLRLTMEYCVSALRSDKRSAAAKHPRDLALVAVDLVQRGGAEAAAKIGAALRGGTAGSKDKELWLRYCRVRYDFLARTVPECRRMVEEFVPGGGGRGNEPGFFYSQCADMMEGAIRFCDDDETVVTKVGQRITLARAMLDQMAS